MNVGRIGNHSMRVGRLGLGALVWLAWSCVPDVPPRNMPDSGLPKGRVDDQDGVTTRPPLDAEMTASPTEASEPGNDGDPGPAQTDGTGAAEMAGPMQQPGQEDAGMGPVCGGADLDTDPNHCGLCGFACEAGEACLDGKCALACDADLQTDANHCGSCGRACRATQQCVEGACTTLESTGVSCPASQTMCGTQCIARSACCDDLSCRTDGISRPYCDDGTCVACLSNAHCQADELCESGQCVPKPVPCGGACEPAEQCIEDACVCPGDPDLSTDTRNCGRCGVRCVSGQECAAGRCQAYCGGARILTDKNNCGRTCEQCADDEQCSNGECTVCGDIQTDPKHCGACDNACGTDEECFEGECRSTVINPKSIGAGSGQTCAIRRSDGVVMCWGTGVKARPPSRGGFRQVCGGTLFACALDKTGRVECWGDVEHGVMVPVPSSGRQYSDVSCGLVHACGVRASSGRIDCWRGFDEAGAQMFDRGQAEPPAGAFESVSAGGLHACVMRSDGTAMCWGLLDEVVESQAQVGPFSMITSGFRHSCGVRRNGSLRCWGWNPDGQLDSPGGTFVQASAGTDATCATRSSGQLACWGGANAIGQPPSGTYSAVSAGQAHACALTSEGAAVCWGNDSPSWATGLVHDTPDGTVFGVP